MFGIIHVLLLYRSKTKKETRMRPGSPRRRNPLVGKKRKGGPCIFVFVQIATSVYLSHHTGNRTSFYLVQKVQASSSLFLFRVEILLFPFSCACRFLPGGHIMTIIQSTAPSLHGYKIVSSQRTHDGFMEQGLDRNQDHSRNSNEKRYMGPRMGSLHPYDRVSSRLGEVLHTANLLSVDPVQQR